MEATLLQLTERFRDACNSGQKPRLEEFWDAAGSSASEEYFRQLMLIEIETRSRSEAVLNLQDCMKRYQAVPVSEDLVRSVFEEWKATTTTGKSQLNDSTIIKSFPQSAPQMLDRYEIRETLGAGGFGTVYRAWDPRLEREVALKVPHDTSLDNPDVRERYLREARAVAGLRHPGICPIHEIHELPDGTLLLSLAYIPGEPLSELIRREAPISETSAALIVSQVARSVEEAHRCGVLHRDLKPQNILMPSGEDHPVVTDFGLARRTLSNDTTLTHEGVLIGTPAYMSPEQARGEIEKIGVGTDIYSLGVILYEMLSGQRPFSGKSVDVLAQIIRDEPKPPSELRSGLNPALESICMQALSKNSEDRFPDMRSFVDSLDEASLGSSSSKSVTKVESTSTTDVDGRSNIIHPRTTTAALAGLLVVAGVIVGVMTLGGNQSDQAPQSESSTTNRNNEERSVENISTRATSSVPGSPLVGRWKVYSSALQQKEGLLEILETGEAKLFLRETTGSQSVRRDHRTGTNFAIHSAKSLSTPVRTARNDDGTSAVFSVSLQEEHNPPPAPNFNSPLKEIRVNMKYDVQNVGPDISTLYSGYDVGSESMVAISWTNQLLDADETFPHSRFSVYADEEWSLTFSDNDHLFGVRKRISELSSAGSQSAQLQINFDQITLIRESASRGTPLPPGHWLVSRARYGKIQQESVAYLFLPDGQLFLARSTDEVVGGRRGKGGLRLTYRVLDLEDSSVGLEINSQQAGNQESRPPWLKSLRFHSKEQWDCRLSQDAESSPGLKDVIVDQHTKVIEVRTRLKTVYKEVQGKKVPQEVEDTYGVEIPIVKTFHLKTKS